VTLLEISAHELFLAAERAVEACLSDASPVDNRVDADGVDPVFVKQFAGRCEQPLPRRLAIADLIAHKESVTDRSV
jgi:hypothetical protein